MNIRKTILIIKRIWENKYNILEGIYNRLVKNSYVEKIAAERMAICNKCKYKGHGLECVVPGADPCCTVCGCDLETKTRSLATECPQGYWGPVEK